MRNTNDVTFKLNSNCSLCLVHCSTWNFFLLDSSGWPPFTDVFPGQCLRKPVLPGWVLPGLCSTKESWLQGFPGLRFLVLTVAMIKASIPNICLCSHRGFCCPLCWPQRAWSSLYHHGDPVTPYSSSSDGPGDEHHPDRLLIGHSLMAPVKLPGWLSDKESVCQCRRYGFDPWEGKIPWKRKQQPTPVRSHEQRNLADYSSWSRRVGRNRGHGGILHTHGSSHRLRVHPVIPPDAASLLSHIIPPCLITGCSLASPLPVSIFQSHISATISVMAGK